MAHYRNFEIEMTVVPDAAGQYEAAFVVHGTRGNKNDEEVEGEAKEGGKSAETHLKRYAFPPVGSYPTPDDAREQTEGWARKWIDANFSEPE